MQLVRQVQQARHRGRLAALAQVTGVATWVVVAGFVMFVAPRRVMTTFGESKLDIAKLTVRQLAAEAYPRWLAAHPGEHCPPSLDELASYIDPRDTKDPWGERYVLVCTPAFGRPIVVSSGEDVRFATPDDVRSDE